MAERVKLTLLEELSAALRIDEYALNDECREQPTLFYRVSREVAMALSRRDAAETDMKRIEAQLQLDLRDQSRDDATKITVDEVKARVREDARYLDAVERLSRRQEEYGEWQALKESYQQRSYALNHLVDLYLGNYYGNIERRESSDARTRSADNARERMSEMRREAAGRESRSD